MTTETIRPDYVYLRSSDLAPIELRPLEQDPEDFVIGQNFEVVGVSLDYDSTAAVIGEVAAQRVALGAAMNAGIHSFDVMDSVSQDLSDLHGLMFDADGIELDPEFEGVMGDYRGGFDLLYIPTDEVLHESWGPTALRTLQDHAHGCGFVIVGVSDLVGDSVSLQAREQALARGQMLAEMGYTRYALTPFYFLNLAYRVPAMPTHLMLVQLVAVEDAAAESATV